MQLLGKLVSALQSRQLTLEQAFRAADRDFNGSLSIVEFVGFFEQLRVGLSRSQIEQVAQFFDDDCSGTISYREFSDKLAAHGLASEEGRSRTYEQEVQIIFVSALQNRGLDPIELFRILDVEATGSVSVAELSVFMKSFGSQLSVKDIAILMRLLDSDMDGRVLKVDCERLYEKAMGVLSMEKVSAVKKLAGLLSNKQTLFNELFPSYEVPEERFKLGLRKAFTPAQLTSLEVTQVTEVLARNGMVAKSDTIEKFGLPEAFAVFGQEQATSEVQPVSIGQVNRIYVTEIVEGQLPIKAMCPTELVSFFTSLGGLLGDNYEILKLKPNDLVNCKRFVKYLSPFCPYEPVEAAFAYLDYKRRSLVYIHDLLTVLDSFSQQAENFPIKHNPQLNSKVRELCEHLVSQCDPGKPAHMNFTLPLKTFIVDYVTQLTFLKLARQDWDLLATALPRNPRAYHIATMLQSFIPGFTINPDDVMRCVVDMLDIKGQGPELFGPYRISSSELISKGDFFLKFGRALNLSAVEAEVLYEAVMGKDLKPAYHFFTYYDTFITAEPKALPFKHEAKADVSIRRFFQELAAMWTEPPAKYGLSLTEVCEFPGISTTIAELFRLDSQLCLTNLQFLATDKPLRMYHLLTVLDSYRTAPLSVIYEPYQAFLQLYREFSTHFPVGQWLYQKTGHSLDVNFSKAGLQRHLNFLSPAIVNEVFCFLDCHNKGYVYLHQFCTLADICVQNKGQIQFFPYWHNPRTPKDIRNLMTQLARNLDDFQKSAVEYKKTDLLERHFLHSFQREESNDILSIEAESIFNVIELNRSGSIYYYHWVSALESFCKSPRMEHAVYVEDPKTTVYSLFVRVPPVLSTLKLLDVTDLNAIINLTGCASMMRRLQPSSAQLEYLFKMADTCKHDLVFAYQFIAVIDMHRACLEGSSVMRNLPKLPFKGSMSRSDEEWRRLASTLDSMSILTWDYNWVVSKDSELSSMNFIKALSRYFSRPAEVFEELTFEADGLLHFYVFLAVLESYRTFWIEPIQKDAPKGRQSNLTPLQDALDKLSRYLAGENEHKRKLTGQELFGLLDRNKDGSVTKEELFSCLNKMPIDLTPRQKELLLREADLNRNNRINYQEFTQFLEGYLKSKTPKAPEVPLGYVRRRGTDEVKSIEISPDQLQPGSLEQAIAKFKHYILTTQDSFRSIEVIFARLDINHDGVMTIEEFELGVSRMGLGLSPVQVRDLASLSDSDHDGVISYLEFVNFIYDYKFAAVA